MRVELEITCLLLVALLVSGCAGTGSRSAGSAALAGASVDGPGSHAMLASGTAEQARDLPKSRYGNPAVYEVFGKQYRVMNSAVGYQQKGIASWYGSKFHGRKTSSGEVYNMYNMTAAHTSLPIPTFVKVRNLDTNQSIVVKVNDRGPFHAGRIIDLSYAAAAKLGVLEQGTAPVEVTAISRDLPPDALARSGSASAAVAGAPIVNSAADPHIIQVGAFSVVSNAESMRKKVDQAMQVPTAYIVPEQDNSLYRVRFGVAASTSLDDVFTQLEQFGIENYSIISD